jgi:outer membrane receptor protein involved in Fe transport
MTLALLNHKFVSVIHLMCFSYLPQQNPDSSILFFSEPFCDLLCRKFLAMKKVSFLFYMLVLLCYTRTQASLLPPAESDLSPGTIKGKVVEGTNNTPVEYATVSLYAAKDSTMIDGLVTNSQGYFEFKKVPLGEYRVIVGFMGFRKVKITGIIISDKNPVTDIGTITLKTDVTQLDAVEIVGNKPLVEYKIDRKVVNVDQQLNAQGGTAVDVLERVPSIKTDLDGNVSLRGSTSFTVLIDGKPSILTGSDALNQIPASTIDKIEIITNPSAKYDPDGTAGIINIITKKNSLKGLSGIVNLSAGTSPDYSGSINLNYRSKKASYTLGADFGDREMPGYRTSTRESYLGDTTSFLDSYNINNMVRKSMSFKAGFDYSLTDKNTIAVEGNYRVFNMSRDGTTQNESWSSNDAGHKYYLTKDVDDSKHPTYQVTLRDIHKFNDKGTELTSQLTFNQGKDTDNPYTQQYYTDESWKEVGDYIYNYKKNTSELEKDLRADFDFDHNFSETSKLEAGVQIRMERSYEDYLYYNHDSLTDTWIKDTLQSNKYNFFNDVYALYGTYSKEWNKLGLKAGLRAEYTDRNLHQITGQETYPYQKFDVYPSLYLTYKLPYNQQMQLSYSKRVNRPRGNMLNPYVFFSDAFTSFSGNPDLEPEFSHNLELNYQKYFGYSFLTLETYYRLTNNKMTRVQELNDQGVMVMTMENINNDRSLGIEASGNIQVCSWFTINPVASVYDYRLHDTQAGEDSVRSSTNWNASIEFAANLKTATKIRLNANYDSPTVTVDGTRQGSYYLGFSARQDFLKNTLSVTVNIRDILDSRRMKESSTGDNYYITSENWRKAPIFALTLSYKWNNYSRRKATSEGTDSDYDVINMNYY